MMHGTMKIKIPIHLQGTVQQKHNALYHVGQIVGGVNVVCGLIRWKCTLKMDLADSSESQ
jgi:hypothetical protein